MCGRYNLSKPASEIAAAFGIDDWPDAPSWLPGFNLAPTRDNPVLVDGEPRSLRLMRWGLVPHWAKDIAIGSRMINARAETLTEKPSFRQLIGSRRCAVVAEGYYEWRNTGKAKTPCYIHPPDDSLLTFAGLWDYWKQPDGGWLHSYTIVTTIPAKSVESLHDRMPVILPRARLDAWLSPDTPRENALAMLEPYPGELAWHEVSTFVNAVRNDGPQCIQPDSFLGELE